MRALVVSDAISEVLYSPEVRSVCAGVELVLSCGDLPYEYLEYIATALDAPLLYVPGNHDGKLLRADGRESDGPEGGRSIDGSVVRVRGRGDGAVLVAGLGGSGVYCGGPNERTEWDMRRRACRVGAQLRWHEAACGRHLDVAITHAAPRGIHDDANDPCHRGFESFVGLMRRHRPKLWLHGHVHPSYGIDLRPVQFGGTEVRAVYGHQILEVGR